MKVSLRKLTSKVERNEVATSSRLLLFCQWQTKKNLKLVINFGTQGRQSDEIPGIKSASRYFNHSL